MLKSSLPELWNLILFGNRVTVDVISKDKAIWEWNGPLTHVTGVFYKKKVM
jgi:hypothetical protein